MKGQCTPKNIKNQHFNLAVSPEGQVCKCRNVWKQNLDEFMPVPGYYGHLLVAPPTRMGTAKGHQQTGRLWGAEPVVFFWIYWGETRFTLLSV